MKMKKIAIVVFLIFLSFFLTACDKEKESKKEEEKKKEESYSGSLDKMMALGIPLKCQWKKDEKSYGTSWIKGKSYYSEIIDNNKTFKIVYKDDCLWSWEEGNTNGSKICQLSDWKKMAEEEEKKEAKNNKNDWQDLLNKTDYKCYPSLFEEKKLIPPQGVNFVDINQLLKDWQEKDN